MPGLVQNSQRNTSTNLVELIVIPEPAVEPIAKFQVFSGFQDPRCNRMSP